MPMGPDGLRLEAPDTFLVVEQASAALTRITLDAGGNMDLVDPAGAGDPELPFVIVRRTL